MGDCWDNSKRLGPRDNIVNIPGVASIKNKYTHTINKELPHISYEDTLDMSPEGSVRHSHNLIEDFGIDYISNRNLTSEYQRFLCNPKYSTLVFDNESVVILEVSFEGAP